MKRSLLLLTTLTVVLGFTLTLLFSSCDDGPVNPPVPPIIYSLDIFLYQSTEEIRINEHARVGGFLSTNHGDTLHGERIEFVIDPPELLSMTPAPNVTYTDTTNEAGFRENIRFTGREVGLAVITAKFKRSSGDATHAQDTLHVRVVAPPNE